VHDEENKLIRVTTGQAAHAISTPITVSFA